MCYVYHLNLKGQYVYVFRNYIIFGYDFGELDKCGTDKMEDSSHIIQDARTNSS